MLIARLSRFFAHMFPRLMALRECGVPMTVLDGESKVPRPVRAVRATQRWLEQARAGGLVESALVETAATAIVGALSTRAISSHLSKRPWSSRSARSRPPPRRRRQRARSRVTSHLRRARHAGEGGPGGGPVQVVDCDAAIPGASASQAGGQRAATATYVRGQSRLAQTAGGAGAKQETQVRPRRHPVRRARWRSPSTTGSRRQCTAQLYSANAAQAHADLAGKLAGDTVIRAPFDGLIGERYVNVGEYVQPASRVASVYSVNPARVSISVPERPWPHGARGAVAAPRGLELPRRRFPAVVRLLGPPCVRRRATSSSRPSPRTRTAC
jgi:hypothetical protein